MPIVVVLDGAWTPIPGYRDAYWNKPHFIIFTAAQAPSLDAAVENQTQHTLRPFGTAPTVTDTTVGGRQARHVKPSADAPPLFAGYPVAAAAIVDVGHAFAIGGTRYNYVVVTADAATLAEILPRVRWE